jgi:hypothetical protein
VVRGIFKEKGYESTKEEAIEMFKKLDLGMM